MSRLESMPEEIFCLIFYNRCIYSYNYMRSGKREGSQLASGNPIRLSVSLSAKHVGFRPFSKPSIILL